MSNAVDDQDVENLKGYRICTECVGEKYLSEEVARQGEYQDCSYCGGDAASICLDDFADYIDRAFEQHYFRTDTEPDGWEYQLAKEGNWERHGERTADAIANAAQLEEDPAEHVRQILYERHLVSDDDAGTEESEFDEEAHYEEDSVHDEELQAQWQYFQTSLQTESRLFNREAESTLDSIFEGLEDHRTQAGRTAIVAVGPGQGISALYRARVFQSDAKLEQALARPDIELGPPSTRYANAGRMNARGIAVFYGATNADVALAETRPPVGSKVVVARFEITRPLRLLDIEVLREVFVEGSIFDESYLGRLEKAKFLRTVSHKITAPVMPDDEPFEYLVTQAIADYLAGRSRPPIDGIIYPSVQSGGNENNVVLFHKAARVEILDLPSGTKIDAFLARNDEEGVQVNYSVHERIPAEGTQEPNKKYFLFDYLTSPGARRDEDTRVKTLKLALNSVTVYHVNNVTFGSETHEVPRHRSAIREPKF